MPVLAWCTSLMPALAWCTSLRTRTAEALPINFRHGRHESSQLQREAKRLQARRGTYRRRRPSLSWRAGFGANGDGPSPLAPIRGTPGPLSHSSVFYTDSSHKYQPRARRYGRRAPHPARRPPAMRSRAHLGERGGARGESRRERRRGPSSTGTPGDALEAAAERPPEWCTPGHECPEFGIPDPLHRSGPAVGAEQEPETERWSPLLERSRMRCANPICCRGCHISHARSKMVRRALGS